MSDTYTSNLGFQVPTVGGDSGTWGTVLNTDLALIDSSISGKTTVALTGQSTLTFSFVAGGSDQFKQPMWTCTGTAASPTVITLPAIQFQRLYQHEVTSGTVTFTLGTGGSTVTFTASQVGYTYLLLSDGVNLSIPIWGNGVAAANNFAATGTISTTGPVIANNISAANQILGNSLNIASTALIGGSTTIATTLNVNGQTTVNGLAGTTLTIANAGVITGGATLNGGAIAIGDPSHTTTITASTGGTNLAGGFTTSLGPGIFNTNLQLGAALQFPNVGVSTPATGSTFTLVATNPTYVISGGGTLAALTINAAAINNNQWVEIIFGVAVTALSVTGGTNFNAPTSVAAGKAIRLMNVAGVGTYWGV